MKNYLIVALSLFAAAYGYSQIRTRRCSNAWIFFDLGNTIVDTKTNNYKPMFYMRDVSEKDAHNNYLWQDGPLYVSAKDYVKGLDDAKVKMGMLIDIPERWGPHYPADNPVVDLPTAKVVRLIDFLAGKVPEDDATWKEGEPAWDYSYFGAFSGEGVARIFKGSLLLPQKDTERKSNGSLVLFQRAVALAAANNCKAIYQGEDAEEMKLAEAAGMLPFQVGVTSKKYFYLPPSKVDWYAKNYRERLWQEGLGRDDF